MSYNLGFLNCPNLPGQLEERWACNQLVPSVQELALLGFLWGDGNRGGTSLQQSLSPGNGKIRKVELFYQPRLPESEVSTTVSFCDIGTTNGQTSLVYDIDETVGVKVSRKIQLTDLIRICKSNDEYFADQVAALMDAARRKLATVSAIELAALTGSFSTKDKELPGYTAIGVGGTVKTIKTRDANQKIDDDGIAAIDMTARFNQYCSVPIVIGDYEIANYMTRLDSGCCFDGLDIGSFANQVPRVLIKDHRMNDALAQGGDGAMRFATMSLGTVVPVWFNRFQGAEFINEINGGSQVQTVLVDPFMGIPWDFRVDALTCGEVLIELGLATQLKGLPTDMFCTGDELEGNVYVHEHLISN